MKKRCCIKKWVLLCRVDGGKKRDLRIQSSGMVPSVWETEGRKTK